MRYIIFLFMVSVSLESTAESPSEVDRLGEIREVLPTNFCLEKTPLRQCYDVTESECLMAIKQSMDSCLAELKGEIPSALASPGDISDWHGKVGRCSAENYSKYVDVDFVETEDCTKSFGE